MRRLVTAVSLILLLGVTACAPSWKRYSINHAKAQHASDLEYEFVIAENFEDRRFELRLGSDSARQLCIHVYSWPNDLGQLHFGEREVSVAMDGVEYPIQSRNFGYCSPTKKYGCYHVIPPGNELRGFIAFSEFDPTVARERSATREIAFSPPTPVVCP